MIQDIDPHTYDNSFDPEAGNPQDTDALILVREGRICLKRGPEGLVFPMVSGLSASGGDFSVFAQLPGMSAGEEHRLIRLFSVDGVTYELPSDPVRDEALESLLAEGTGFELLPAYKLRNARPKHLAFAAVTGMQLARWYGDRRFCGRCGHRMQPSGTERALVCPECRLTEYPKISPAVIVAVTYGDYLLLSKYAGRGYKNYALLAGFCEIGETPEDTIRREVMEEVGLRVTNIRYYKSQPWSFTDTLLLGFYCDLEGGEEITLDEDELAEAGWYLREEIPVTWEDCSLTNEMIMTFKEGKNP